MKLSTAVLVNTLILSPYFKLDVVGGQVKVVPHCSLNRFGGDTDFPHDERDLPFYEKMIEGLTPDSSLLLTVDDVGQNFIVTKIKNIPEGYDLKATSYDLGKVNVQDFLWNTVLMINKVDGRALRKYHEGVKFLGDFLPPWLA